MVVTNQRVTSTSQPIIPRTTRLLTHFFLYFQCCENYCEKEASQLVLEIRTSKRYNHEQFCESGSGRIYNFSPDRINCSGSSKKERADKLKIYF